MSLQERIEADLKTALKAKQADELRGLRAIKAQILLAKTEKGGSGELSEAQEMALLQKAVKQRKESAEIFTQQNRPELAASEMAEVAVIERYLPAQMSHAELEAEIKAIIAQVGAEGPKDMGKVMGAASKVLAGRADNKAVAEVVKALLG